MMSFACLMIRIVLSPTVEQGAIRQFAERLRAVQKQTLQLTVLDFENRPVRRAERKAARDCSVRCIDFDAGTDGDVVCDVARGIFGSNAFLYRELDHYHDIDICRPLPSWLSDTFGSDQLAWLLDGEETPVLWNREAFFVIPGNPDSWDVTVPINVRLFILLASLRSGPVRGVATRLSADVTT